MTRGRALFFVVLVAVVGVPAIRGHAAASGPADDMKVWIDREQSIEIPIVAIDVATGQVQTPDTPLVFHCTLRSKRVLNEARLGLAILDSAGTVLYQGAAAVSIAGADATTHHDFQWDARTAPTGDFTARFSLTRPPELPVAEQTYVVRKVSLTGLKARFEKTRAALTDLDGHVTALESAGKKPPYARMRLAIAGACIQQAQASAASQDWRRFDHQVRYLERTQQAVRTMLVFGEAAPEFSTPLPKVDLSALEARNGGFEAGGRPVFLLGQYLGGDWSPERLRQLGQFGLNFAAISVGPKDTLAGPDATLPFRKKLDPFFKEAADKDLSVAVSLDPESMPQWARDLAPGIPDNGLGVPDITQPAARKVIKRHFAAVVPYLAEQKMLDSICVAYEPEFEFTGETVRQGFLDLVKKEYGTHAAVNQSWQGLFANLDEIAIGWDRDNPKYKNTERYMRTGGYQYDWQTYHQQLSTDYIAWLVSLARTAAPRARLSAACTDRMLEPKESMFGINREAIAPDFDINACCAANGAMSPVYAIAYPREAFTYTLMRSLAPTEPLMNMSDQIFDEKAAWKVGPEAPAVEAPGAETTDSESHYTFETVHSMMWEAAMAGLDASAFKVDNFLSNPECLEGYVTACLDLNRLAEVVQAFQKAAPDVWILWSMPSKIYADGVPYLGSVKYAYEGCSFGGYKLGFITEKQCVESKMAGVKVFVLPETPAVSNEAFGVIKDFIQSNRLVIRTAAPILYDEHGHSRRDIINITRRTVLVHGENLPTEFLHAMDGITNFGELPPVPRTANEYGYPIEGVKTLYTKYKGEGYLYVINLRKNTQKCWLLGDRQRGRDLIQARDVVFPIEVKPLAPMLIRLEKATPKPETEKLGAPHKSG